MSEWEVGEATPAERRDLARREIELFGSGDALDPEWLLDRNPAGKARVLVARTREGRIAGTRALLPWRVLSAGTEILVGQSARLWTEPEFRRQGVSLALGRELERRALGLGYPIAYAFPSDRSLPGHQRLGNRLEISLERRQMLLSARFFGSRLPGALNYPLRWMRAVRSRVRPGESWSIADAPGRVAEHLWKPGKPGEGVIGVRDRSFVEWRFSPESGRDYVGWRYPGTGEPRLLAFVHHAPGRRARVIDLWGPAGPEEKAAAVAALVRGLAEQGAVLVEWCLPKHGDNTNVANRVGFFRRRRGVPMGLWLNRPPDVLGELADPVSYRLTEGDSDYA